MVDLIQECRGIPVNSAGELVFTPNSVSGGNATITGYLPPDCFPLNTSTGGVACYLPSNSSPVFSSLDIQDRTASKTMNTTQGSVLILPTVAVKMGNFEYDSATGIITFLQNGIYSHNFLINVNATALRSVYAGAQVRASSGASWSDSTYSGRKISVSNGSAGQIAFQSTNYFTAGTQLRFLLWASASLTALTEALDSYTGTINIPAIRIMYTSTSI